MTSPSLPRKTKPKSPALLPTSLGIVSLVSAGFLLFGALQKAGLFGGSNVVWQAWATAPAPLRFGVMLAVLAGLLGAGASAMTVTWRRFAYMDLIAASSFLVAGIAFLVGATTNTQYGASKSMPLAIGAILASGFAVTLMSAWRRLSVKGAKSADTEREPHDPHPQG